MTSATGSSDWLQASGSAGSVLTTITRSKLIQLKNGNFNVIHESQGATPNFAITLYQFTKTVFTTLVQEFDRTVSSNFPPGGSIVLSASSVV